MLTVKKNFVINIRPTLECNADCSYCSSYRTFKTFHMTYETFKNAIDYMPIYWRKVLKSNPDMVSVQYLGGEVLTCKYETIESMVNYSRKTFNDLGIDVIDGVQTNLLANKNVINKYLKLFKGRIGTSLDVRTGMRTVNGSVDKYRSIFKRNDDYYAQFYKRIPAVIVLKENSENEILQLVKECQRESRDVTIRPIYNYGKYKVNDIDNMASHYYVKLFDFWYMKSNVIMEPFFTMLRKSINLFNNDDCFNESYSGCHENWSCVEKSISFDPDGSIYQCTEFADSDISKYGNVNEPRSIDYEKITNLMLRKTYIENECNTCEYITVCKGGCMADTFNYGGSITAKTPLCKAVYYIYDKINRSLDTSYPKVLNWLNTIDKSDDYLYSA